MSASTMQTMSVGGSEKSGSLEAGVLTINNNVEVREKLKDESIRNSPTNGALTDELTDGTASDDASGDAVCSESSGVMYGSDDIIFDDDLQFEREMSRSNSVDYLKVKAVEMLQQELLSARKELKLKDAECKELVDIRTKVEAELEELTASLFEEAHKMVHEANMKQFVAEKKLKEAAGEIEALRTETSALKSLVLTSTPSNPNPQHHPQLIKKKREILVSPIHKHRRNRSNIESSSKSNPELRNKSTKPIIKMGKEIDSVLMGQLSDWLQSISLSPPSNVSQNKTGQSETTSVSNGNSSVPDDAQKNDAIEPPVMSQLIQRIEEEDIKPCLTFSCASLAARVSKNVSNNSLTIEALPNPELRRCALSETTVCCKHRIKCGNSDEWYPISQSCRTRIASVCDFLTYIRYLKQGLLKHTKEKIYWEINRLRREMVLAKLGYYKEE